MRLTIVVVMVNQTRNHLSNIVTQSLVYLYLSPQYLDILLTKSLENLTLINNRVEDSEVDKLINWIIIKLDLIAIIVKNNKVDSGVVDQTKNCLKSS